MSDVDPAPTVWTSTRLTALAGCSAVQLVTGTLALRYAVERGLAVDIAGIRRRGAEVPSDSWFLGTGITAPIAMMAVQAVAIGRVLCGTPTGRPRGPLACSVPSWWWATSGNVRHAPLSHPDAGTAASRRSPARGSRSPS